MDRDAMRPGTLADARRFDHIRLAPVAPAIARFPQRRHVVYVDPEFHRYFFEAAGGELDVPFTGAALVRDRSTGGRISKRSGKCSDCSQIENVASSKPVNPMRDFRTRFNSFWDCVVIS